MKPDVHSNRGMTMVEVIVVLVILSILAAMSAPSLIGFIGDTQTKDCNAKVADIAKAYIQKQVDKGLDNPAIPSGEGSKTTLDKIIKEKSGDYTNGGVTSEGVSTICPSGGVYTTRLETGENGEKILTLNCSVHGDTIIAQGKPSGSEEDPDPSEPEITLNRIEVDEGSYKKEYFTSEDFSSQGTLKAIYSDNSSQTINLSDSSVTCAGFVRGKLGIQTIQVSYGGATDTFQVTVKTPGVKSFVLIPPTKKVYNHHEALDVAGGQVTLSLEDGTTETKPLENAWCQPTSLDTVGEATITVTYPGISTTQSFKVTVNKTVMGIELVNPSALEFFKGHVLIQDDLKDLKIREVYSDGTTGEAKGVELDWCSPKTLNTVGTQTITIIENGMTTQFAVTVKEDVAEAIYIKYKPNKVTYIKDEPFTSRGGSITVRYNSGRIETIDMTDDMCSNTGTSNVASAQPVTVTFQGKTVQFNITITNAVTKIELVKDSMPPQKFVQGQAFSVEGGLLLVTYQNNATDNIPMDINMCSGYNMQTLGSQTVTVTYGEKTTNYKITINKKVDNQVQIGILGLKDNLLNGGSFSLYTYFNYSIYGPNYGPNYKKNASLDSEMKNLWLFDSGVLHTRNADSMLSGLGIDTSNCAWKVQVNNEARDFKGNTGFNGKAHGYSIFWLDQKLTAADVGQSLYVYRYDTKSKKYEYGKIIIIDDNGCLKMDAATYQKEQDITL